MANDVISLKNPKSVVAEAFRTLRTNIQFSSLDNELKTIVVTSTQPSEGKSTVLVNLAVTMAQSGKKVVLLDCDLRKPTIHRKLGVPNKNGLTTLLSKEKSLQECLQLLGVPNLYIITSGPIPPNPAELLGSKRMKGLLQELKEHFDVILIDAPPVLAVTDSQILSTLTDGVLFVTAYGTTEKEAVVRAKELIEKVGGKILGVVMNKMPADTKGSYTGYYYYSYE
ncbi:CpsD/CapB family tyrosine-protein kinase [Clostridium omnivorum]|uniref:non-specific protein-tyrosine kinase n=1 Tax=Clostridium omnivorum TaxID=1604902 RepID=A0ABQ5N0F7_9CLOT|nr:CpsD/CapB family tyrosine-protein kinase [Clostridium sp. E14]GLC28688.1 capsular polysaccharide biosynthesis protein [Clostridium sp. E14]